MRIRFVVGLVLVSAVALFALQNAQAVQVRFLFWSFSVSQSLGIFIVFLIGIVLGWIACALGAQRRPQE